MKSRPSFTNNLSIVALLGRYRFAYFAGACVLLVSNSLSFLIPWLTKHAVDDLTQGIIRSVGIYAGAIVVTAIVQAMLRVVSRALIFGAGRNVEMDVRQTVFEHLQTCDGQFFQRHPSGELCSLITNDSNVVRLFFGMGILNLINGGLLYVIGTVLIFTLNPQLALWAVLPYLGMILVLRQVTPRFHEYNRELQEQMGFLTEFMQENINGQEVLRSFGTQVHQEERFSKNNFNLFSSLMRLTRVRGILFTTTSALAGLGTLILLWVGGRQVIDGMISLGDFVAFSGYLGLLVTPTLMFGFVISIWYRGTASLERIRDVISEGKMAAEPNRPGVAPVFGDLSINNLTFAYPQGERAGGTPVLKAVSLTAPKGKLTAVVGPIGSGKSTLSQLFFKFYPVEPETLYLGGEDITKMSVGDIRAKVTLAPQEPFLFSKSIGENIAFGFKGAEGAAGFDEASALENAFAQAELKKSNDPEGLSLKTVVGEKGVLVSGGQRQRIGLARVFASTSPYLILDEPFSSLDIETAENIFKRLVSLLPDKTILVITHRMSLAKKADHIIVMDRGEVVGQGDHETLLKTTAAYRELLMLESYAE